MSKTISVALCVLLMTVACKKTTVEIRIRGAAALVEQSDRNAPVAVVFPKIGQMYNMPAHIPYVAWLPEAEISAPNPPACGVVDPVDQSRWQYHELKREELVLQNDLLPDNPSIIIPDMNAPCTKQGQQGDIGCVPQATAFLKDPDHSYNDDWVKKNKPSPDILGRFEITRGTLSTFLGDGCKWDIMKEGGVRPIRRYMATSILYNFTISGRQLNLGLRQLDPPYKVSRLVSLKANKGAINIRIGNAIKVFPGKDYEIPHNAVDEHFAFYYKFLHDVAYGPLPKRTFDCAGPFDEVVYCGPGWVKGKKPTQ